ncbi:MAG: LysM peptidoglycan-binding domain-containing protein, partial [Candidatus Marinimicrobia bacterium]|nr:LysM peptidoglycan-binding domain-containing protein [Candidatus Neomarinimicrobiota bacterium]
FILPLTLQASNIFSKILPGKKSNKNIVAEKTISEGYSHDIFIADTSLLTNLAINDSSAGSETLLESDRFDELFGEAKIHYTNALIADHFKDSLEAQIQLGLCFESLTDIEVFNNLDDIQYEEITRFSARLISDFKKLSPEDGDLTVSDRFSVSDLRLDIEHLDDSYFDGLDSTIEIIEDRDGHLPIIINDRVRRIIKFFQNDGKEDFQAWLNRLPHYENLLVPILKEEGLPEEFLYLSMIESGLKTNAYSYARAMGLWQFIYATGKHYGLKRDYWIDERMDFEKSTHAAARYLKDLHEEFGDWYLAMAAYNYGEGRIRRNIRWEGTRDFWKMRNMPRETRNYVPTVLAAAVISKDPEKYGFKIKSGKLNFTSWDTVSINKSVEIETIARACSSSYKVLKQLNPELRKHATPQKDYLLRIPSNTRKQFLAAYDKFDALPSFQVHIVRRGETLTRISRKYGTSVRSIMSANKLHNRQPILIGQKLTIPIPGYKGGSSIHYTSKPDLSGTHEKQTHIVRKGQNLGFIAEEYKTRASKIRDWNRLKYKDFIYPNQKLIIWVPKSSISGSGYTVRRGDS